MTVRDILSAASSQGVGSADPYFYDVSLLLTGDGTNGAQNNTFLDSSTNNFTITRNGNTTQGTFSPYGNLWSNYFDGSSYLTLADNTAWRQSGDYTIECWYNPSSFGAQRNLIGYSGASNTIWLLQVTSGGVPYFLWYNTSVTGYSVTSSTSIVLNTWNHIAVTFEGSNIKMWLNGISVGTTAYTGTVRASPADALLGVGSWGASTSDPHPIGYMSNARIVKGTALYTSAFTPSTTPLTAVSGTSLLTCQSNRFIDNSSNNFTLTVNGTPSVQRFSPFNPTAPYSAATIGGSGYFDGSGDYLNGDGSTPYVMGTGDFTIECWVNFNSTSNSPQIYSFNPAGTNGAYPLLYVSSSKFVWYVNNSAQITGSVTVALNTWYHVAICRSGTSTKLFVNGVQDGSTYSDSNNYSVGTDRPNIGRAGFDNSSYVNGYISDFRLVKGTAVYTTTFTPPTAPLTAITNTSLLCNFTNAGIPDAAMMNDLETVGNAQISTSVKKYGTGSMKFDGTNSALVETINNSYGFGTGDFTVEFWVNPSATPSGSVPVIDFRNPANSGESKLSIWITSANKFVVYLATTAQLNVGSWTANNWTYVALCRVGSTITLYINGTSVGTFANSTDFGSSGYVTVAADNAQSGYWFNGYIDDLRITKGYARYTANFTPPTAALPTF